MKEAVISEETKVPMRWVISLLVGCAAFTGSAVFVGMYFGSRDANAGNIERRVTTLEDAVKRIPEIAEGVARLEGKLGTRPDNRTPAGREK